jgi:hypothetical protein
MYTSLVSDENYFGLLSHELRNKNTASVIMSRRMRWVGHVARMREMRNAYKIVVGKAEGKRQGEKSKRRWEDNIRMDLR